MPRDQMGNVTYSKFRVRAFFWPGFLPWLAGGSALAGERSKRYVSQWFPAFPRFLLARFYWQVVLHGSLNAIPWNATAGT